VTKQYPLTHTRNIGIVAHIDAGKTTTSERILYYSGVNYKIGEVDHGTATMDWMPQEKERGITIVAAATNCYWKDHRINLIDTPGHVDFTIEVERSLRVLDGAVAILDAGNGVEPQTEKVWRQADKYKVPRLCYVNKMDKVGANFEMNIASLRQRLDVTPAVIQWPLGESSDFKGIIDLVKMVVYEYDESSLGQKITTSPIPSLLQDFCLRQRQILIDTVAEFDESVTARYLDGEPLTEEDIKRCIRIGTIQLKIVPVLCGSSFKYKGVQQVLDAVVDYLPSPLDRGAIVAYHPVSHAEILVKPDAQAPLAAVAFKIMGDQYGLLTFVRVYSGLLKKGDVVYNPVKKKSERIGRLLRMHANDKEDIEVCEVGHICAVLGLKFTTTGDTLCFEKQPVLLDKMEFPEPVISVAIEPQTKADQDKLGAVLQRMSIEDPSFRVRTDEETGQTLISGMGELHLDIIVDRLKRENDVRVQVGKPQVAYRETISTSVNAEAKHIRPIGAKNQYGHVILKISPLERGGGFIFENKLGPAVLPVEFALAAQKGVEESLLSGVRVGYPLIDLKVELVGGSFVESESNEMAFKIASSMALKDGCKKAMPVLLEPLMAVEISTPEEYVGNVVGDLSRRRGQIHSTMQRGINQIIKSEVPLAEMFGYVNDLRSMSKGHADYSMAFARYDVVPNHIADAIIAKLYGGY